MGKTVDIIQTQGESREEHLVCHGPTGPLALSTLRAWLLHFPKTHGCIREQMPGGGRDADPAVQGPRSQDSPRYWLTASWLHIHASWRCLWVG